MALSKNEIKFVQSLRLKKFRQKYDNFIAEGEKIAAESLQQSLFRAVRIYAVPEWLSTHPALTGLGPTPPVHEVSETELGKISGLSTPNKVLLVLRPPADAPGLELLPGELALFLDDLQDPGNLGAILRIADWFGIARVFCSPGSVDVFNPKVVQGSMGAFLRVQTAEAPLAELRRANPDAAVMGALLDGANIFESDPPRAGILIIGNESKGISPEAQGLLTHRITIPKGAGGGAESLNAAVAAGILVAFIHRV